MKVSEICPLICGILVTVFVKKQNASFGDILKTSHRYQTWNCVIYTTTDPIRCLMS